MRKAINKRIGIRAAYLKAATRMTNVAISKKLGVSQATVSKAITEALNEGLLRLTFDEELLSAGDRTALRSQVASGELRQLLAQMKKVEDAIIKAPNVHVFDSGSEKSTREAWPLRLSTFAKNVAPLACELIRASKVCSVSWGETMAAIVHGIETLRVKPTGKGAFFVPACGDMLDGPPNKVGASSLAYRLDVAINDDPEHRSSIWMAGVPARYPDRHDGLTATEIEVVKKYIRSLPAYKKIFGDERNRLSGDLRKPLVDKIDLILTSCGPAERPLGYGGRQLLRAAGLGHKEARDLIAGDLSGNLLKRASIDEIRSARIDQINAGWCGVTLKQLAECNKRSRGGHTPGVALCALGANKVESVLEVTRLGLANHLLIDNDLASELERRIRKSAKQI